MSFIIQSVAHENVTLPLIPENIKYKKDSDVKSYTMPGTLPLLISFGGKADVLVIDGWFRVAGQTKVQLIVSYVSPLDLMLHEVVTIQYTGRSYHNSDFLFKKFDNDERKGITRAIPFRMEFWKGSTHTVI